VCGSVWQCIEPTNRCYSITAKCNTCVVVCCSVLQCSVPTNRCRTITAKCNIRVLCCSELQCVAMCCSASSTRIITTLSQRNAIWECCSVLHCIAVCGSVLQFVEPTNRCYSITAKCNTCIVVCCSVLQCSVPTNRCRTCFDEATWDCDKVPLVHREPVTAPWAAPTSVPSVFLFLATVKFLQRQHAIWRSRYFTCALYLWGHSSPQRVIIMLYGSCVAVCCSVPQET